jgi:predicted dehydrogenase
VGLGKIAEVSVLPAFRNCKKAKLEAVVSRDKRKAARFARKFRANAYYQNEECDAEWRACRTDDSRGPSR